MPTLDSRLQRLEKTDASPAFDIQYFFACLFRSPGDAPPVRDTTRRITVAEYYSQLLAQRNG